MKDIKCYRVFLCNKWMRRVIYLIYPLITICWSGLIASLSSPDATIGLIATAVMVIFMEVFLDQFVYGGIFCKDTNRLAYLMTSCKGITVLEKGLRVDKLRRLLSTAVIYVVIYRISHGGVDVIQLVGIILAVAAVTESGLLITRGCDTPGWILLVSMVGDLVGGALVFGAMKLPAGCVVLFLILYGAVAMVTNRLVIRKAREQYYDGKMEDLF